VGVAKAKVSEAGEGLKEENISEVQVNMLLCVGNVLV